tara:strand:- start:29752 stop:30645 length:894 start_codon:yes stop_codon:yes gene_type:complete
MNKRALVTGLGGFTGAYVAAALESNGWEVVGLDVADCATGSGSVDLRDATAVAKRVNEIRPDAVIHLAAIAFVAHDDVADMYTTNVIGTHNLLQALAGLELLPQKVVLASSANIYGSVEVDMLDEGSPMHPGNNYAVSKCAMEMMAATWQSKLPIVITRPFNYTGVGQSSAFLVPKVVDHFARAEKRISLGNIDVYRDFSDVRTVAEAYARLLESGQAGQVYNICSGHVYCIDDILRMLSQIAGYQIAVDINPQFVRENEVRRLGGSNKRLLSAVGVMPQIDLADTLNWMYEARVGQ